MDPPFIKLPLTNKALTGLVDQSAGDGSFLTGTNPSRLGEAPAKPEVNSPLQSCRTQFGKGCISTAVQTRHPEISCGALAEGCALLRQIPLFGSLARRLTITALTWRLLDW